MRGSATHAIRDILPDAEIADDRPPQAGDYSFNNIGLPSFFMLSSTMPEALREEKELLRRLWLRRNIAWHTENDTLEIADRDILLTDMKIYLLATLRIANAEVLPFDWAATATSSWRRSRATKRRPRECRPVTCTDATEALKAGLAKLETPPRKSGTKPCCGSHASWCRSITRANRASVTIRPIRCRDCQRWPSRRNCRPIRTTTSGA